MTVFLRWIFWLVDIGMFVFLVGFSLYLRGRMHWAESRLAHHHVVGGHNFHGHCWICKEHDEFVQSAREGK